MLALSFDPIALERCFLVADVLAEDFGQPLLEYALIGLSASTRPLHVVQTPLLPGQRVTRVGVEQSGLAVLRLRREIERLSRRVGQRLLPVTFIHRHCGANAAPSEIDRTFLRGVFVDQVSTVLSLPPSQWNGWTPAPCGCGGAPQEDAGCAVAEESPGVAFSLIVTRLGAYTLQAAAKHWCASCGRSRVSDVPARLICDPEGPPPPGWLTGLREALRGEIAEKFDPADLKLEEKEG